MTLHSTETPRVMARAWKVLRQVAAHPALKLELARDLSFEQAADEICGKLTTEVEPLQTSNRVLAAARDEASGVHLAQRTRILELEQALGRIAARSDARMRKASRAHREESTNMLLTGINEIAEEALKKGNKE